MFPIMLKFGMDIADYCRTNPIHFGECRMHSLFTGVEKEFLYVTAYGLFFMLVNFRALRLCQIQ